MFDEKIILTRLQNGEDVQAIANEITAMLNAANKAYTDQKTKEAKVEIQKKEELQEILDLFMEWLETFYDIKIDKKVPADSVIELIDSLKEYIEALEDLESVLDMKKPVAKVIKSNTKPKNADEQISDFLKKMGW